MNDILAIRREIDNGDLGTKDEYLVIQGRDFIRWTSDPNLALRIGSSDEALRFLSRARVLAQNDSTPVKAFMVVRLEAQRPLQSVVLTEAGNQLASAKRAANLLVGPLAETLAVARARGTVSTLAALIANGGPVSVSDIEQALTSDLPA